MLCPTAKYFIFRCCNVYQTSSGVHILTVAFHIFHIFLGNDPRNWDSVYARSWGHRHKMSLSKALYMIPNHSSLLTMAIGMDFLFQTCMLKAIWFFLHRAPFSIPTESLSRDNDFYWHFITVCLQIYKSKRFSSRYRKSSTNWYSSNRYEIFTWIIAQ